MRTIRVALSLSSALLEYKVGAALRDAAWAELSTPGDVIVCDARRATGQATVAVLTGPGQVGSLVRAGVTGLVLADDPIDDLVRAVHDVHRLGGWVSPRLVRALLPTPPDAALTARERETLTLLADGRENAEIAAEMFITVSAVKYHVSNLLRKFGCRDRTQLVCHLGRKAI